MLLTGCTSMDYSTYVDAQVRISRDSVIRESAQLQTLLELAKSSDPTIRAIAIMQLERFHERNKINIQPPK